MFKERGSQRGAIEMLAVGGIALLVMAGMIWVQQLRINAAVAEKEKVEIALTTANTQVKDLGDKNKQLDEVLETVRHLAVAAQEESALRQADIAALKVSVSDITKKIPKVVPKPNEPPQDAAQVERSRVRAVAMQEAYCLTSPSATQCVKETTQ